MQPKTYSLTNEALCRAGALMAGGGQALPGRPEDPALTAARRIVSRMSGGTNGQRYGISRPLVPVFRHLNGEHTGYFVKPEPTGEKMPDRLSAPGPAPDLKKLADELRRQTAAIPAGADGLEARLNALENVAGVLPGEFVPGSPQEPSDISLFDELRMTAALAACLSVRYPNGVPVSLPSDEKAFLLYSADFSGIQKFIYASSVVKAVKNLRSRSFFLELMMEYYADELLGCCGVSRANLIYIGGGHCYVLLPDTPQVREAADAWNTRFNRWLSEQFDVRLYIGHGYCACSENDLVDVPSGAYEAVFRSVSSQISERKLHRFTAEDLLRLNKSGFPDGQRECRVCGCMSDLKDHGESGLLCPWCILFEDLSKPVQDGKLFAVSYGGTLPGSNVSFKVPAAAGNGQAVICVMPSVPVRSSGIVRVYSPTGRGTELPHCIRIFVGRYHEANLMSDFTERSKGISRIAVCRMDVDNLGQAFIAGFRKQDPAGKQPYVTLLRTAAFSRQMSRFFKCYLNNLPDEELLINVVYSGGDDVFILGSWDHVIRAAELIRDKFREFSCGSLTISAGVGIYDEKYPIRYAADDTALLEDEAKKMPGKDSISLFAPDSGNTYSWSDFKDKVENEKLKCLRDYFNGQADLRAQNAGADAKGMAALYNLLDLLRQAQSSGRIALARYAYQLSRMEPSKDDARDSFKQFSGLMYKYALKPKERRQLITAIYLYVYSVRKKGD